MDPSVDITNSNWPLFDDLSFYKDEAMLQIKEQSNKKPKNHSNIKFEKQQKNDPMVEECNQLVRDAYEKIIQDQTNKPTASSSMILYQPQNVHDNASKVEDDMEFFQPLIYYMSLVTGSRKLDMRMQLIGFVKSVVFKLRKPVVEIGPKIPFRFILDEEDLSTVKSLIPYTSKVKGAKKVETFA